MLPEAHRLRRSSDFALTIRRGRRSGRSDVVVHVYARGDHDSVDSPGRVRVGLVISKAVGPAVTRHRVARRLRHICSQMVPQLRSDIDIVLRALPSASRASSEDLGAQVRSSLAKLSAVTDA